MDQSLENHSVKAHSGRCSRMTVIYEYAAQPMFTAVADFPLLLQTFWNCMLWESSIVTCKKETNVQSV